ncbi:MAG: hypothetical protein ACRDNO_14430, partial [Trebonia sp.]
MTQSFPRQQARTRGFRLGVPRAFHVSPDGERITFLRSKAGDDPVTCLWEADAATGEARLVADPRTLGVDEENLPAEERARRERVRETAAGIVAYATNRAATLAVFALYGQVYAVPLGGAAANGGAAGAGQGDRRGDRGLRHRPRRHAGRLRALRAGVRGTAGGRGRHRPADPGPG